MRWKLFLNGTVVAGDVVVIRYEGPKGGPGMRNAIRLQPLWDAV